MSAECDDLYGLGQLLRDIRLSDKKLSPAMVAGPE